MVVIESVSMDFPFLWIAVKQSQLRTKRHFVGDAQKVELSTPSLVGAELESRSL